MINRNYFKKLLVKQFSDAYKNSGLTGCARFLWGMLYGRLLCTTYPIHKYFIENRNKSFEFDGKCYKYCTDVYNLAWRNERAVEIPIITSIVKDYAGRHILEVGDVLSHYTGGTNNRTVVDLYEKATGINNVDITKYFPEDRFDLIFSISTIEHIGIDDEPKDTKKAINAIHHCVNNCLLPGGLLVITIPVGYNKNLDRTLNEGELNFDKKLYLSKIEGNEWIEAHGVDTAHKNYESPFVGANTLFIGTVRNILSSAIN